MRTRTRRRRVVVLLVLSTAALGAVLALVKGQGYGLGYYVGNLSAPYLVAAFVAGRAVRRRPWAAAVGVAATWATLLGFYLCAEIAFGYPTGSMTRFSAEWFLAGALSGSVLGLLGRESRGRPRLILVLPIALVLEPAAVVAVQAAGRFGGLHPGALQLTAWCGEVVVGAVAVAALGARRGSRRRTAGS